MNVFKPAQISELQQDLSGHYMINGEYQGRKFIIDDPNPLTIGRSLDFMLDDIALRTNHIEGL